MQKFNAFYLLFLDSIFHKCILKAGRKLSLIKVGELSRAVIYIIILLSVFLKRILERVNYLK